VAARDYARAQGEQASVSARLEPGADR